MPGAGGNLGVENAARAAPDGYTILTVSTGFIINPSMYTKIGYDPVKDFAPISLVAASPNVITVHPSVPAKDLKELIAPIKNNPGKFSFAQPATGSTPHLAGELLKQSYNLDLVTVPFNAAPLAINSTLGNHTPIALTALPPAIGNIKDGSLRGIAILAKQRVAALPELPTNIEEGVPGLESDTGNRGAGRHAPSDHRQVERVDCQNGRRSGDQEKTRRARLRAGSQQSERVRRTHQIGDGALG